MIIKKIEGSFAYICIYPFFRVWICNTNRAYVLLTYENKIVLTQNWLGWHSEWSLPGGGIHGGENPKDAVAREVKEELNIIITPSQLTQLGNKSYKSRFASNYLIYKCDLKTQSKIITSYEILQAKIVNIKDLKEYKLSETTQKALSLAKWKF